MKPLIYYCRWHEALLRLRGRDKTAVWGQFVYKAHTAEERSETFRFELASNVLTIDGEGGQRSLQLDAMGTIIAENPA